MFERGVIRNREYAQQIRDFRGLRYGAITPTDIDGFMDFGNRVFVFLELKHGKAPLPFGQRLALERLAAATTAAAIPTYILVGRHDIGPEQDIDAGGCLLTGVWHGGKWSNVQPITIREAIDRIRAKHNI